MLPRGLRLNRTEVAAVVRRGQRLGSKGLSLRYLPLPASPASRWAVIVPAKEVKTAVGRHLLKRRIRAAIGAHAPLPAYQIVIFADKLAYTWDYPTLQQHLDQLLHDL